MVDMVENKLPSPSPPPHTHMCTYGGCSRDPEDERLMATHDVAAAQVGAPGLPQVVELRFVPIQ